MDRFVSKIKKHIKVPSDSTERSTTKTSPPTNLFDLRRCPDIQARSIALSPTEREIKIRQIRELGNVSSSSTLVKRDLGFQGKLGHHILLTYGDTMFTDAQGSDTFRGMTCNSAALACDTATQVFDPLLDGNSYPHFLLKPSPEYGEDPSVHSLGITNFIETTHGKGIVYFLLNHRPDFKDNLLGAGVAEISITDTSEPYPIPVATRLSKYWWDAETEPWYGDVCALRAGEHIYAYGHAKDNPWVYLARVKAESATNLTAYEYWNGDGWQSDRLTRQNLSEKESIFWQVNQGQIIWSPFHNCFLFVYCDNFWSCQILVKTAHAPQGPWSEPITMYKPQPVQEGGNVYAAIPHPYFDPSCKTLIVTYTNHPNTIQAIEVEFE